MARLRLNNVFGTRSSNPITLDASTGAVTWASAPVGVPTIAAPDYLPITVEPDTTSEEIVWVTAYTAGATSGTCLRAQESSSIAAHTAREWAHTATAADFKSPATRVISRALFR